MESFIQVKIIGKSMEPAMKDGDSFIFDTSLSEFPQLNDIVLIKHPFIKKKNLVKRVKNIHSDGSIFVEGDNKYKSTDSRTFGYVKENQILGILKMDN